MVIQQCQNTDCKTILFLYEEARRLQILKQMVVWPYFEIAFILREIEEGRQWKLLKDGIIACNWSISFEDKEIWEERDQNNAIYIHRICTHPDYRSNRHIDTVVNWAIQYAKQHGKQYVRLDTLGNNQKLIQHYTSAGFNYLGMFKLGHTSTLPLHYQQEPNCCLFELELAF